MKRYVRIYARLALNSFASQATTPLSSFGYLLGKMSRVAYFLIFLFAIFKHTDALAGYRLEEAALFFLTFNVVDMVAQLFFRGIYGIRAIVRDGDLDFFLIQPLNVLYRVAFNTVDFLDLVTILPVFGVMVYLFQTMPEPIMLSRLAIYGVLVFNGLLIAFSIHILVAALAVLTQELENTIWIYRDLMTLGRFPSDIYDRPMRFILTFFVPVAVMVSFPAKAYLGQLPWHWILHSFWMAGLSVVVSLFCWNYALARYTSSSS